MAMAVRRSRETRRNKPRADLREQGRSGRRLKPASARPDLRDEFCFQNDRDRSRCGTEASGQTGRVLFADIIEAEKADGRRIIFENERAIAFLPYFARYAYEVYVAPKRSCKSVAELSDDEIADFAAALKTVLVKYDNLWKMPFPYVMPLHNAPTDGGDHDGFHFQYSVSPAAQKAEFAQISRRARDRWR